jgi:23S rRNA (pseudouridine1915-N3)-methyltransferase
VRLSVIAVGRLKAGPEKDLADEYRKRSETLGRKAGITRLAVTEFSESQASSAPVRIAEEAQLIASALPPRGFTVVLDEAGKSMTSNDFAAFLQRQRDGGTVDLAFVVGGPDGHAKATRAGAGLVLSLGAMTWPHRLVRVLLFEQIYRAVTIMVNHPYHRA